MKIREAFGRFVLPAAQFADSTTKNHRSMLSRWERLTTNPPVKSVTSATIAAYRTTCKGAGYAPDSTEGGIRTILRVLRACQEAGLIPVVPSPGVSLTLRQSPRYVPPLADFGLLHQAAEAAKWPTWCDPAPFWRTVFAAVFWTGCRRGDAFGRLLWESVTADTISWSAAKTGKLHVFPMHPVLKRHLESWRASCASAERSADGASAASGTASARRNAAGRCPSTLDDRLFPIGKCNHQILREMRRMSAAAGVRPITLQSLRRLSATEWQAAKWGAGEVVQGCALGKASRLYIVPRILQQAAPLVEWPSEMLTAEERDRRAREEAIVMDRFRRLGENDRGMIVRLVEGLAS